MSKENNYELSEPMPIRVPPVMVNTGVKAATRPSDKISVSLKCSMKVVALAAVLNFILLIVLATALFFQTAGNKTELHKLRMEAATKLEVGELRGQPGDMGGTREPQVPGIQGPPGPPGPPGDPGPKGSGGNRGQTGEKGEQGENGSAGLTGARGDRGQAGMMGAKGSAGSPGAKGERGVAGPPGTPDQQPGGITYKIWGRSHCRSGAVQLYSGRMGATHYSQVGGASNYMCMPNNPVYGLSYRSSTQGYSYMYGVEYKSPLVSGSNSYLAPCALCYVPTKQTVVMIPANTTCPTGWTREYHGYLMSGNYGYKRTSFECIDASMEIVHGSQSLTGDRMYHVEAYCGGLSCPPYDGYREINCRFGTAGSGGAEDALSSLTITP